MRKPSLNKKLGQKQLLKGKLLTEQDLKYDWLRSPEKYVYNKVYQKTTFDIFKWLKKLFK